MKKRLLAVLAAILLIAGLMPVTACAAGSIYVSTTSISLKPGESSGFSFVMDNAAGAFSISKSGPISVSSLGEGQWLDDDSLWINVVGEETGTGYIYIEVYDAADYDENDLSGMSFTITVNVNEPDPGYSGRGETIIYDDPDEHETTTPENTDLDVQLGDETYKIVDDLSEITPPAGFSAANEIYNDIDIQVFVNADIKIYVLKGPDDTQGYYVYDEAGKTFIPLNYQMAGDRMFIFLDAPADFEIPAGYKAADFDTGIAKVKAVVRDDAEFADFYYVYCMADGVKGWYSYDSAEQTWQRLVKFEEILPEEPGTKPGWAGLDPMMKGLLIALGAAIIIIILLLILLIAALHKKGPKPPKAETKPAEPEAQQDTQTETQENISEPEE